MGVLAFGLASAGAAQTQHRLTDPQSLSGMGAGWSVDMGTGRLSFSIPVAVVPGEIPIPAFYGLAGSHSVQRVKVWVREVIGTRTVRLLDSDVNVHRPMVGSLHFGFIDNGGYYGGTSNSATYVLENGAQYREGDWVAFTLYNSTFTLPADFGLAAISPSFVKVSSDRNYAYYTTTLAGLGATVSAKVQATLPVGHDVPTQYRVLLDKDRARVMAYLSGLNAWAPVLWLDRFGHQAAFKWTVSTSGLPAGATALHNVVVTNQRSGQPTRGLQVEWASWVPDGQVRDLLRADFIGIDAPSIMIKGYSGAATAPPVGLTYTAAGDGEEFAPLAIAGVSGRPTTIQVGHSTEVAEPIWGGTSIALPSVQPMVNTPPNPILRQWSFNYDANKASLIGMTDASGVFTAFTHGVGAFPLSQLLLDTEHGPIQPFGVIEALSTDSIQDPVSGQTPQLKRTWTRTPVAAGTWTTTYQEWWPSVGPAERKYEFGFGSGTAYSHYLNAQIALQRVLSADGATEYSKTIYSQALAGLTNEGSLVSGTEISRMGESTRRELYDYTNGYLTGVNLMPGPFPGIYGAGDPPIQVKNINYEIKRDKLDIGRPLAVTVTAVDGNGAAVPSPLVTKYEYNATSRLLEKTYRDGGIDGQIGQVASYDSEGRLRTQANFASSSTDGVSTAHLTYGADGYLASTLKFFTQPSNQTGLNWLSNTATYDSAGRAITSTDALGVKATATYDTLGRLKTTSKEGAASVEYEYPDPRTRTMRSEGRTTTELVDGFGRVVRVTLPDTRRVEFIYDAHGRKTLQKEFAVGGGSSRSSSTNFDLLDRPTLYSAASGASQSVTYSASADLKQSVVTTSVAGVSSGRKVTRNVLGQIIKTEELNGATVSMSYDGAGNLTLVNTTDANGHAQQREFKFNLAGLMTEKKEPETGTQIFSEFNALGLPTSVVEASGTTDVRTRAVQYDGLGRMCKLTSSTGSETIENFFDGALLKSASSAGPGPSTMAFDYKPSTEGRRLAWERTTFAGVSHTLSYGYQPNGSLDTITYPSGRIIGYSYDAQGRPVGIQDKTGGGSVPIVSNLSFDEWGQWERLTFGSTAYSDWSTQKAGTQLKDWTIGYTTGGVTEVGMNPRTHAYDLADRLTDAGEWRNLTHDAANRIGSASSPLMGVDSITYNHDVFDNNTDHQATGVAAPAFNNFSFDSLLLNKLPSQTTTGGLTGWIYAGTGEAKSINTKTSGEGIAIGWDALGRVKTLVGNSLNQAYYYAPSGLRIRVQDAANPANNRRYVYTSGGLLMAEYLDSGWKRDVVYLGSEAVAEIDAAGIHELHSDHLGTPRIVTNHVTGQIEGKQAFGPYGERMASQETGYEPLTGYTGHLRTEPSGLIYMRGRFYSPAWHRFLNSDQGVDPNSWNQMAYVGGSPFQITDPSGMKQYLRTVCTYHWTLTWSGTRLVSVVLDSVQCTSEVIGTPDGDQSGASTGGKAQTPDPKKDCQQKALNAYRNSIGQAIGTYNSATSNSNLIFGAYRNAPSSMPNLINNIGDGLGIWGQIASKMGLKSVPTPVTNVMWAGSRIWAFMDGMVGVQNAVEQAGDQFQKDVDSAVKNYWSAMGDCK